jgi:hypothetical protein
MKHSALIKSSFLVLSLLFLNCCSTKNDSIQFVGTLESQISNSNEFASMLQDSYLITVHPRKEIVDSKTIEALENTLNSINTDIKCQLFLDQLGLINSTLLVNRIDQLSQSISKIFLKYPQLYNLSQHKVAEIFKLAYKIKHQNVPNLIGVEFEFDECSSNYAASIEVCSDALAWDLIGAGIGGILSLPGTPIASTGTVLVLSSVAYFKEHICKVNVLNQWKACRALHPINK